MTIEYYIKEVYGNSLMYATDEKMAHMLYSISGQKTITPTLFVTLTRMGHAFELTHNPHHEKSTHSN